MSKILQGKVISNKMADTLIVEVLRLLPHPLYKKLLRRSKKYKVAANGQKPEVGTMVKIIETKPLSKDKHFALFTEKIETVKAEIKNPKVANKTSKTVKEKKA